MILRDVYVHPMRIRPLEAEMMLSTRRFGELGDTGETRGTRILVSDSELFHSLCSLFVIQEKSPF